MDDGEEIERTRHDYVQRVAHPLVAGVTRNTHPVMTQEAKAKAELWCPDLPLRAIEQVDRVLTWSAGRCCIALRYSANLRVRKCRL